MKLPAVQNIGVQSLGRENVNAPLQVANAWANTLGAFSKIALDMQDAKDEQALQSRLTDDILSTTQLEAYLNNTPVIDLNNPEVPEVVYQMAMEQGPSEDNQVKTSDIMLKAMEKHIRDTSASSMGELTPRYQAQYLQGMRSTWTNSAYKTGTTKLLYERAELKGEADRLYAVQVDALNEEGAHAVAAKNLNTGAWTPDEYEDNIRALGETIDYNRFQQRIRGTTDLSELEAIEEDILSGDYRLRRELRSDLLNQHDKQVNAITSGRGAEQEATYREGVTRYGMGNLTKEWVTAKVATGELDADKANQLFTMAKNVVADSAPLAVADFERQTYQIRYFDIEEEGASVSQRAEMVRQRLNLAVSGVDILGNKVGEPTISSGDYARLMRELDAEEQGILTGRADYKNAVASIRALTGYSGMFATEGQKDQQLAYYDFKRALDRHMDTAGAQADPVKYVNDRITLYEPYDYAARRRNNVMAQFPKYASKEYFMTVIQPDGSEEREMDTAKVISDLRRRVVSGEVMRDNAEHAISVLVEQQRARQSR